MTKTSAERPAIAAAGPFGGPHGFSHLPRALGRAAAAERERWILWTPAIFGIGIAGYFALPVEPPLAFTALALSAAIACAALARGTWRLAAVSVLLALAGFAAAQARTLAVAAPVLQQTLRAAPVTGVVELVEALEGDDLRLILDAPAIAGLAPEETPARLRLSVRTEAPEVRPGDRVRLLATLEPPPEPVAPQAFDFARKAYFERIGAVGYALSKVERVGQAPADFWRRVHGWRAAIAARVRVVLPERSGAMAAALLTGLRGGIAEEDAQAMRDAGLAHLLAISGLHVGLVTATAFFFVRAGLAAIPALAVRLDLKKAAAIAAWIVALVYLLLSGATVPTQRAFLMVSVVLLALLLGRQPISMRLVAFAAFGVMLIAPEAVLSASFQMSFAAVVALVAAYEALAPRLGGLRLHAGAPRRVALYFLGVLLTTLIAEAAIAPFAAFHFNRVTAFGLLANLVAVPAMAFLVMPLGLLALVLMPLGLDGPALWAMGQGVELVIATAHRVAGLPGAAHTLPAFPAAALALGALGALWLFLWRDWRLKAFGLAAIAAGAALAAAHRPPDMLVSRQAELFGLDRGEGFYVSSLRRARYSREQWTRRAGEDAAVLWTEPVRRGSPPARCDALGCAIDFSFRGERALVAVALTAEALEEDCGRARVLLSAVPVRRRCPVPEVIVDRFDVWREGAHALWLGPHELRVLSVAKSRGRRPWVRPGPADADD